MGFWTTAQAVGGVFANSLASGLLAAYGWKAAFAPWPAVLIGLAGLVLFIGAVSLVGGCASTGDTAIRCQTGVWCCSLTSSAAWGVACQRCRRSRGPPAGAKRARANQLRTTPWQRPPPVRSRRSRGGHTGLCPQTGRSINA
jgi:hypothetical protein